MRCVIKGKLDAYRSQPFAVGLCYSSFGIFPVYCCRDEIGVLSADVICVTSKGALWGRKEGGYYMIGFFARDMLD